MQTRALLGVMVGIVLIIGITTASPAFAATKNVDTFETEGGGMPCDFVEDVLFATDSCDDDGAGGLPLGETIDGNRKVNFEITAVSGMPAEDCKVDVTTSTYDYSCDSGYNADYEIIWDGGGIDPDSLDEDLTSFFEICIEYIFADSNIDATFTIEDNGADSDSVQKAIPAHFGPSILDLCFPLSEFNLPALDLDQVKSIKLKVEPQTSSDFTLSNVVLKMPPVGGTMMPADSTALLLAGAELNAIWILPMIVAIGIGAFIVSRKR